MTAEKIRLPDFLIADLYKTTLVDLSTPGTSEPVAAIDRKPIEIAKVPEEQEIETVTKQNPDTFQKKEKVAYLGKNGKNIVIAVHQKGVAFLSDSNLTFLTNILKACQLNLADIAIVNLAENAASYIEIKEQLNAQVILLFDVEPSAIKLPFMIPAFQVQKYDGCTIMVSPELSVINKETKEAKVLKSKLWMSLKQVFGV
jgi:anti-anti-sigma regulatory factor